MLQYILRKLFDSRSDKILRSLATVLNEINRLEKTMSALTDSALQIKTLEFKRRLNENISNLDTITIEAFAVVRETAKRVLGERHYDMQILGGLVLNKGMIAEMKTGEGKTLASSLTVYLNALSGNGVHVITVNDYLAKRDSEWMGKIYRFHNLTVGCLTNSTREEERKKVYECDIVYGTNNEFGFDYLRDHLKHDIKSLVQKKLNFAIIDEVDSILIDEARTPLVISTPSLNDPKLYININNIAVSLNEDDYQLDEQNKTVSFTDKGSDHIEQLIKSYDLIQKEKSVYDIENIYIMHHLNQAVKAHKVFKVNSDYIIKNGKVLIIDEFTGRIMDGRRYSEGLHEAIEAKENVSVQQENQVLASITYQNYFRMYPKLAGMTGTAITEAQEFLNIYNLEVVQIPTNIPVQRLDKNDIIYKTEDAKNNAIITEVKKAHIRMQPVLIGTVTIEKSELISRLLKISGIEHKVLNAKFHREEAKIIAQAGELNAVTIATNMAGRGTDIKLGGNENSIIDQRSKIKNLSQIEINKIIKNVKNNRKKVLDIGGLFVIGTERHESRRIDNQLRGRSGRQGDFGKTQFFLSLEDDLMRIFGSVKISHFLSKLGLKDDEAIEHPWISKSLEKAQHKVEARNYEIRKNLLKFDDVMNEQRKVIYKQRINIMKQERFDKFFIDKILIYNELLVTQFITKSLYDKKYKVAQLVHQVRTTYQIDFDVKEDWQKNEILNQLNKKTVEFFHNKISMFGNKFCNETLKSIFIINIDKLWKEHMYSLDRLKIGINLRVYGQKDPLNEYKLEAFKLFQNLLLQIDQNIIASFSKMTLSQNLRKFNDLYTKNEESKIKQSFNLVRKEKNLQDNKNSDLIIDCSKQLISRNQLCPCGSTKKYKHCHGSII